MTLRRYMRGTQLLSRQAAKLLSCIGLERDRQSTTSTKSISSNHQKPPLKQ